MKKNCYYWTWGGDKNKNFPVYPKEYGAKCMYFKEFFNAPGLNCERCGTFRECKEIKKEVSK